MKVLSFIIQRSFARYVALDLASAAERAGWTSTWIDIEGRLLEAAGVPDSERPARADAILAEARASEAHLAFSYGLEYLAPAFAKILPDDRRSLRSELHWPAVYFLFDFGFPFDRPLDPATVPLIEALQTPESLVLCWDRDAVATAKRYGILHAQHFPMAVNQALFTSGPDDDAGRDTPVIFAGGPSPERIAALRQVADLGLVIYGYDRDGWAADAGLLPCYRPALLGRREMAAAYRQARIAINVTRPHGPSSLNMRVYEAMASGCLLLTDDRADVHTMFTDGEHLRVYRSPDELRALVSYYLLHEDDRRRVAAAGRERVLSGHTYEARLLALKSTIETFATQTLAWKRLLQYETTEPEKALSFANVLRNSGLTVTHPDAVPVLRALCLTGLRREADARRALRAAFAANPMSLGALRVARALGETSAVPEVLAEQLSARP
jgi:hypothetical protein